MREKPAPPRPESGPAKELAKEPDENKKFVKSVLKALAIIDLLDDHGELGVTEISNLLGLDKSTTFRLLATLKEKNYILANPRTQKYCNGGRFFVLGQGVLKRRHFNPRLDTELRKLADATSEAVNFAVPDGLDIVILASYETEDVLSLAASIGQRRPMYCTSVGKAMLAAYSCADARALCDQFHYEKFTENTITDPDELMRELATTRQRGYSLDNQEHRRGLYCVGAPLLDRHGEVLAGVSVSMPLFRCLENPGQHDQCVAALLGAVPAITAALLD